MKSCDVLKVADEILTAVRSHTSSLIEATAILDTAKASLDGELTGEASFGPACEKSAEDAPPSSLVAR